MSFQYVPRENLFYCTVADPAAGVRGARNMKSMRLPVAAIFLIRSIYFYRAGGRGTPLGPPASATAVRNEYFSNTTSMVVLPLFLTKM